MLAVASLWKPSTFEILEVVAKVVVADHELRGLLDWLTMGILLTELTLVKFD